MQAKKGVLQELRREGTDSSSSSSSMLGVPYSRRLCFGRRDGNK